MKRLAIALLSLFALALHAQDATVNKDITTVTYRSANHVSITRHKEVTIHNKKADRLACFSEGLDHKAIDLGSFSGSVTDATGKVLKKFKKGDLQMSEYSSNFKTNAYYVYNEYTPSQFPVRVTYDYTLEVSNLTVWLAELDPVPDYNVNVEEASYKLTVPRGFGVRYYTQNTDAQVEKTNVMMGDSPMYVYTVAMSNIPAMKEEPLSPSFGDMRPLVEFVPETFNCYGVEGSFESWEALGKWHWDLYSGRQTMPAMLAGDVESIKLASPEERVEKCCALLRSRTRYVSIQLGIGGWQPELASVTAQTGFGDCKALTCLMMGVLEYVGIKSYPVIVNTKQKRLKRDFASLGQCNHVLLCVPQEKDTLWIECTNLEIPANYRHDGIAGHDGVILTPEGGRFVTIPDYAPEENRWDSDITIVPTAEGKTQLDIRHTATNAQYENIYGLTHRTEQEQKKVLTGRWNLGRVEMFKNFEVKAEENAPLITTTISTESTGYANVAGSRLFIPANPMHKSHSLLPEVKNRTQNVEMLSGYEDKECVHIVLPEGYVVESVPKAMHVETPYGKIDVDVEVKDTQIDITYDVKQNAFAGSSDDYQAVCEFKKLVHAAYGQKVILKK